jgi:small GTP-binding protein
MGNNFVKNLLKRSKSNKNQIATTRWISPGSITEKDYQVVLVGGGGVGKSAISIQYISNQFIEDYDPTIEDSYRKQAVVDELSCMIDILDTAGQEEYASLRDQWMRDREGFIIVFSIDNIKSFEEVTRWRQNILRVKDSKEGPIILVANKSDLADKREVSVAEIDALAKELDIPWIEVSAKQRTNIDQLFELVIKECRRYRQKWGLFQN